MQGTSTAEILDDLWRLAKRAPGWNSYDADPADMDALHGAVELVNSFNFLSTDRDVPRPAVGLSPRGAVVLRWMRPEHEVEIEYRGKTNGEYSVLRRDTGHVVMEGQFHQAWQVKDIIDRYVVSSPPPR